MAKDKPETEEERALAALESIAKGVRIMAEAMKLQAEAMARFADACCSIEGMAKWMQSEAMRKDGR